jgi:predicted acylesterase/phospholipase RssA
MGMHTALLRSYESRRVKEVDCTIWEASRATSAASSFFDPIKIGQFEETFVDGGTGCNNPVERVFDEALDIWGPDARQRIQCILSIGTGQPMEKGFGSGLKEIASTLIRIATETEQTAARFATGYAPSLGLSPQSNKVYFRFNVVKGLEEIGLERYQDKAKIASATKAYLSSPEVASNIVACTGALGSRCT